ncbi:uncharacterized protein LOC123680914 [Harmonia axyridis]|uniref:uncharacterized protein LOC123680914 n=1 Tax=Harmonia axyridis TaxID=115357 RepID=UPI001E27970F|nr:uncharacterized protein LOC123680914 [Harmonia axyridis]
MKCSGCNPLSPIYDFIVNYGPPSIVVKYISHKPCDSPFFPYYLEELVRKRFRKEFNDREYVILYALLARAADPMSYCKRGDRRKTVMDLAVETKDVELIQLFLEMLKYQDDLLVDPFVLDNYHFYHSNAVLRAVSVQSIKIVKLALELNFEPDERSFRRNTPLHIAASYKRLSISRYLLNIDVDVDAVNVYGETPLFFAVKDKQIEQAILLLQYGANVKARDIHGNTVLHGLCSTKEGIDMEMCEFLVEVGCDPNLLGKYGQTPLHKLAKNHEAPHAMECAKYLIENGVNVNFQDEFGETALQTLAECCEEYTPMFELLLRSGTDTKILNEEGSTFLDILQLNTCNYTRREILRHLIILEFKENFQFSVDRILSKDELFRKYCRKELIHFESLKIPQFQTVPEYSLYKILISTHKQVSRLCQNPILQSIVSEFEEREYPMYGADLKTKMESGLRLFLDEERALEILSIISNGVLNYDVMIEMMKYVKLQELEIYLSTKHNSKDEEKGKQNIKKSKKVKKVKVHATKYKTRKHKINYGPASIVVNYVNHRSRDSPFFDYYLEELVRKRFRKEFKDREYEILYALLVRAADPMSYCKRGDRRKTVMDLAVETKDSKTIYLLIQFNVVSTIFITVTSVLRAVSVQSIKIVKLAQELNLEPDERSFRRNTPLHIAASYKRLSITRYLLNNDVDVDAVNVYRETPLFFAVKNKQIEQAILLLQYGANVNARDIHGNTVLHVSCSTQEGIDMEMCEFLVEVGCDPNLLGKYGQTALHKLAKNHEAPHAMECAKYLIENGVNVNFQDEFGETALQTLADCCEEYTPMFELLLRSGTDTKILNEEGSTFLDILKLNTCNYRRREILRHLIILEFKENFQFSVDRILSKDELFRKCCRKELIHFESLKIPQFQTPVSNIIRERSLEDFSSMSGDEVGPGYSPEEHQNVSVSPMKHFHPAEHAETYLKDRISEMPTLPPQNL